MEVYLVPIGRGRHVLYCEPGDDSHAAHSAVSPIGWWRRATARFAAVIAAVERDHAGHDEGHHAAEPPVGIWARTRAGFMRWLAEKIAEQRLLWRLGGQHRVLVFAPATLDTERVLEIVHGSLVADFRRHAGWLAVDSVGGLLSLLLVPLPGPNLPGYYFTFRIVGHLLALRGARHGMRAARWDVTPSQTLELLAQAGGLPVDERERVVQEVAATLGLPRLVAFYRRAAEMLA